MEIDLRPDLNKAMKLMPEDDSVSIGFVMNPLEEVLVSGDKLMNGMIVLIEPDSINLQSDRGRPLEPGEEREEPNGYELKHWLKTNRWCIVTELHMEHRELVSFIGLYKDGTQISRTYHVHYYWLVKKDSITLAEAEWRRQFVEAADRVTPEEIAAGTFTLLED